MKPARNWEEFKKALMFRFGPSAYVDFDIDLRNLKQTSTVQEYQERFEDLACMVDWTEKALIAAFVGGLKDEIQVEVRAEPNMELDRCFVKARAAEDRLQKLREIYRPWKTSAPVRGREQPQRPKQLPAPVKKEVPKPVYRSRLPPNMTQEEREELIRNKKCFWCKNDWNSTHQCKHIRVYTVQQEPYEVTEGGQPLEIEVIEEPEELGDKLHFRRVDLIRANLQIGLERPRMWPRAAAEEGRGPLVTRSGLNTARLTQVRVKGKVREVSCSKVQPVFISLELSQREVRVEVQRL
ncbi:hypothetical protein EJ110_NYTH02104 [Nymphaea thermarum]|nr:hypothetical protein EJ110_NYTH02104 [Nymphaea thermarum]